MNIFRLGERTVDLVAGVVDPGGPLTQTEVGLLRVLAEAEGAAIPRSALLEAVWGYAAGVKTRTIDTTVHRLRSKLEDDPSEPVHLLTERGAGVALVGLEPLRVDTSGLIGREALIAQIHRELLKGPVALVGARGMGVSTLAALTGALDGEHPGVPSLRVPPLTASDRRRLLELTFQRHDLRVTAAELDRLAKPSRTPAELLALVPLFGLFGAAAETMLREEHRVPAAQIPEGSAEVAGLLALFANGLPQAMALAADVLGALRDARLIYEDDGYLVPILGLPPSADPRHRARFAQWCAGLHHQTLAHEGEVVRRHAADIHRAVEWVEADDRMDLALTLFDTAFFDEDPRGALQASNRLAERFPNDRRLTLWTAAAYGVNAVRPSQTWFALAREELEKGWDEAGFLLAMHVSPEERDVLVSSRVDTAPIHMLARFLSWLPGLPAFETAAARVEIAAAAGGWFAVQKHVVADRMTHHLLLGEFDHARRRFPQTGETSTNGWTARALLALEQDDLEAATEALEHVRALHHRGGDVLDWVIRLAHGENVHAQVIAPDVLGTPSRVLLSLRAAYEELPDLPGDVRSLLDTGHTSSRDLRLHLVALAIRKSWLRPRR